MSIKHKNGNIGLCLALSICLPLAMTSLVQGDDIMNTFTESTRLISGGITEKVLDIAFSPDATLLAAVYKTDPSEFIPAERMLIILWDPQTQDQVDSFELDNINGIAFSPDGTLLALYGKDAIYLRDVAEGKRVGFISKPSPISLRSVAFSPDGTMLASAGSNDPVVRLWDVQTQQQVGALGGNSPSGPWVVAFSPDGQYLACGGFREDLTIRLWDVPTQQQVGEFIGHLSHTYDLAFSADGTVLASAGGYKDKAVYLWDVQTQNQVGVLGGHSAHVYSIAFSPNEKVLASTVLGDDTIHLWDLERQEQMGVFVGHDAWDSGGISTVAFSSDGKWLACGGESGVELWELDQLQTMLTSLMLFIMNQYYLGNIDAELAWDSLVNVQATLVALDSDNPEDAQAAMNDLKTLINQELAQSNDNIAPETAAEILQRADEITIIVLLGSGSDADMYFVNRARKR